MSIFSKFKFKKKAKKPEKKIKKKEKTSPAAQIDKKVKTLASPDKQEFSETAVRILIAPRITERTTDLAGEGKYTFKVRKQAKKSQIKKAIQEMYGVSVASVNIVNVPRKKRRLGRTEGYRAGFKKAIVSLAQGQKIDIMPK